MVDVQNLNFIKVSGFVLAVAAYKCNCAVFFKKADYGADLLHLNVKLAGDFFHNVNFVYNERVDRFLCEFHYFSYKAFRQIQNCV